MASKNHRSSLHCRFNTHLIPKLVTTNRSCRQSLRATTSIPVQNAAGLSCISWISAGQIDLSETADFLRTWYWKLITLIQKTIGNRKRDCAWGCARGINTTWQNLQIENHKSVRWAERTPSWFVFFDLQIFAGGVYPPSATTSRTISFSISNSFPNNLIHFFNEKKDGAAGNSIVRFAASIPCHAIW